VKLLIVGLIARVGEIVAAVLVLVVEIVPERIRLVLVIDTVPERLMGSVVELCVEDPLLVVGVS
jgi:hypothetical protein